MPVAEQLRPDRAGELDESDALQGLTSKQYRFAVLSFSGLDDSEAYRQAYGSDAENAGQLAHQVARNPKVQSKLAELKVRFDGQTTLAPLLTRQFVINGIMQIAISADKPSTRLRAYELLGKVVGIDVFKDTGAKEAKPQTLEEIDRKLRAHIEGLKPILEATARRVDPPGVPLAVNARDRRRKPKA